MLCSVVFHLFNCISSRAFADFLKLDLCGIGLGILGCYLCGLHLSFQCYRYWRIRYETIIVGIMIIAVIYYVHGVKRYITRNIHVTLFLVISLGGNFTGFTLVLSSWRLVKSICSTFLSEIIYALWNPRHWCLSLFNKIPGTTFSRYHFRPERNIILKFSFVQVISTWC